MDEDKLYEQSISLITKLRKNGKLISLIIDKHIPSLRLAIFYDDARRIHNIICEFSRQIYKETGVLYDDFDYYDKYGDNINGYVNLMIYRMNKAFIYT